MTDLIEVKTADLSGEALGWAVGTAEGLDLFLAPPQYGNPWRVFARYQATATGHERRYNPWEDWALGGPLIDKHNAMVRGFPNQLYADRPIARVSAKWVDGTTNLIALCRAIAKAALGYTVQVPKELMP